MWAQAVSASFHPFIGIAEVVIRNAIHETLSQQCSGGQSSSYAWYDRAEQGALPLKGKSSEKIEKLLFVGDPPIRKPVQLAPDAVVAELTFGFWPNIMEGLSQRYAPKTFTCVFSHHPYSRPQHWSREQNKEAVVLRLKRLQDLRNRVCHFEPVWKPHWLGLTETPQKNWSHAVKALRELQDNMVELLGWCSPQAVAAYKASFGWNWFNRLCTTSAVQAFMRDHTACALLPSFASAPDAASTGPATAAEHLATGTPASNAPQKSPAA